MRPTAPASLAMVDKLVELLCRDRGIAIPCNDIADESELGAPSTGPREMNSVFSKTQTQYGAA